jgi:hypothetical protein
MPTETLTTAEYHKRYGKGRRKGKKRGEMNKLELRFAQEVLILEQAAGEIKSYQYEAIKLKLANGAWYTPDFDVYMSDGSLVFYEVKGHWREAARLRIKVAAEAHQEHLFIAVQRDRKTGVWRYEEF